MKHKTIKKKLLNYLDRELSHREQQKISRHLEICKTCREELSLLKTLWQIKEPIEREKAPPIIWTSISDRLKIRGKRGVLKGQKKTVLLFLRPAMMLVLLFGLLIGGIQLGNLLSLKFNDRTDIQIAVVENDFGRSYFETLPQGSIGTGFLEVFNNEVKK